LMASGSFRLMASGNFRLMTSNNAPSLRCFLGVLQTRPLLYHASQQFQFFPVTSQKSNCKSQHPSGYQHPYTHSTRILAHNLRSGRTRSSYNINCYKSEYVYVLFNDALHCCGKVSDVAVKSFYLLNCTLDIHQCLSFQITTFRKWALKMFLIFLIVLWTLKSVSVFSKHKISEIGCKNLIFWIVLRI
jgi:hypothetical protein